MSKKVLIKDLPKSKPVETEVIDRSFKNVPAKANKKIKKNAFALEELVIVYVPIDSVKPNTYNPNRQSDHDFDLLLRSIREDGFTQPIIVNDGSRAPECKNMIVDGEHRWRAAKHLGLKKIPVTFVPFTLEQMKISTLRHNRARGTEDIELSAGILRDLMKLGNTEWIQDSLMLDDAELNRMVNDIKAPELLASEDYSSAWEPIDRASGDVDDDETEKNEGKAKVSSTAATTNTIREREKRLAKAKTEQEKATIKKETEIYRVSLMYSGEEAVIVKQVLGSVDAAQVILDFCKSKYVIHSNGKTKDEALAEKKGKRK